MEVELSDQMDTNGGEVAA
jgi:hypothetical protein